MSVTHLAQPDAALANLPRDPAFQQPFQALVGGDAQSARSRLQNADEPPTQVQGERWYCLHTRPARESFVAAHLEENGVETYLPRLRSEKVIRRVRRVITRPLFPRYLFCRFDAALQYRLVRHTPEVIDVVRFGEHPAVVGNPIIEDLQSWASPVLDVSPFSQQLRAGDRVTITDGPMQGLHAVILQTDNERDRVSLLLSTLEYQARLMISRSRLERVG